MKQPHEEKDRRPNKFIGIGLVFGAAIGAALSNVALGIGIGLIIGALIDLNNKRGGDDSSK